MQNPQNSLKEQTSSALISCIIIRIPRTTQQVNLILVFVFKAKGLIMRRCFFSLSTGIVMGWLLLCAHSTKCPCDRLFVVRPSDHSCGNYLATDFMTCVVFHFAFPLVVFVVSILLFLFLLANSRHDVFSVGIATIPIFMCGHIHASLCGFMTLSGT